MSARSPVRGKIGAVHCAPRDQKCSGAAFPRPPFAQGRFAPVRRSRASSRWRWPGATAATGPIDRMKVHKSRSTSRYGARSAAWRTRRLAGGAVCVVFAHRGCGRRNPPGGHHRCPSPVQFPVADQSLTFLGAARRHPDRLAGGRPLVAGLDQRRLDDAVPFRGSIGQVNGRGESAPSKRCFGFDPGRARSPAPRRPMASSFDPSLRYCSRIIEIGG